MSERGSITAEFAVVLPAFVLLLLSGLQLSSWQVERMQLVSTAAVAARAASHLMTDIEVKRLVTSISASSVVEIAVDAEIACATVTKKSFIPISEKICTRMQGQ